MDKVVSEIVQMRDKRCVTCGSYDQPTAGHVFSRVAYSTRWDLTNTFRQCWPCNYRHEFDPYNFTEWYRKNYGSASYNRLHRKYETVHKFSTPDLKDLYAKLIKIRDAYIEKGVN